MYATNSTRTWVLVFDIFISKRGNFLHSVKKLLKILTKITIYVIMIEINEYKRNQLTEEGVGSFMLFRGKFYNEK